MNDLIEAKTKILEKLAQNENSNTQLKILDQKILSIRNEMVKIDSKIFNYEAVLSQKKQKFNKLKEKILILKNIERKKIKKEVKIEYENYIIEFEKNNFDSLESFENVLQIIKKTENFYNLNLKIKNLLESEIQNKIQDLTHKMKVNSQSSENIHHLSQNIQEIIELEITLKQDIMSFFLIKEICNDIEYHFLSNKDTNRLDKPEWFFSHLCEKLKNTNKFIIIYSSLNPEKTKKTFDSIFSRISDFVELKFNDISKSNSKQKMSLMIHFCDELQNFKAEIFKNFNFDIQCINVLDSFIKEIKNEINERMEQVHLNNYKKWFDEYEKMLRESFSVYLALYDLDKNLFLVVSQHIIDNIYIYCEMFIKQMRYINREEIHLLCLIFSEIENIKIFITELEQEFNNVHEYENSLNIQKISKFNSDNLKLIKMLSKNDIDSLLKKIKNFKYLPEKVIVNFKIDLNNLLNEYKTYLKKGYNLVEKNLGNTVDDFLMNCIVLKNKFESEEYFEFKEFLKNIVDCFKFYKDWKTITACKCIEDIFNGKNYEDAKDSLFNMIYKNYLN
ncbi:RAD50-interacting protein 1 [Gurleya vavrai]